MSRPHSIIAGALALGLVCCARPKAAPVERLYRFTVEVEALGGAVRGGHTVHAGELLVATCDGAGKASFEYSARPGRTLQVSLRPLEGHVVTSDPITVKLAGPQTPLAPLRFTVDRASLTYGLAVKSCKSCDVLVAERVVGRTDEAGYFLGTFKGVPGKNVRLTTAKKDFDCEVELTKPAQIFAAGKTCARPRSEERPRAEGRTRIEAPPPGKYKVKVLCRPSGLELAVDGTVLARACDGSIETNLTAGLHTFELRSRSSESYHVPAKQIVEVRSGQKFQELEIEAKASVDCFRVAEARLSSAGKLSNEDEQCAASIADTADEYVDAQLLLAYARETRKDNAGAGRILTALSEHRRGRFSAEVLLRLAQHLNRAGQLDEAIESADRAWAARNSFVGSRADKVESILELAKLRAVLAEKLFYRTGDINAHRVALDRYADLNNLAASAKNEQLAAYAASRIKLLEEQTRAISGGGSGL